MSCTAYRIIRRREYRVDLDATEASIAQDNAGAAVAMWLLIDDQVEQLADSHGTTLRILNRNWVPFALSLSKGKRRLRQAQPKRKFLKVVP